MRSYFNIPYAPEVSETCRLDIFIPEGDRAMLLPAFVSIHGGHWKSGTKEDQWSLCKEIAMQGWVAVAVDYRLSGEAPFPAAVSDLRHAIRFLRENSSEIGINRHCIVAEGHSAGGHLAALLGVLPESVIWDDDVAFSDTSSRCQGVISIAAHYDLQGVSDTVIDETTLAALRQFLPSADDNLSEGLRLASPEFYVDEYAAKFMVIHGDGDKVAPFYHAEVFADNIEGATGNTTELITLPGEGHKIWDNPAVFPEMLRFLQGIRREFNA
ncbi:MAG: alpha/beta hydrolase fold domain-containing protein [Opitutales bacterium]